MPVEPAAPSVLHLTAAPGGGVDRYVRDLAASRSRRHLIWHIGSGVDVIEDVGAHRFLPLRYPPASRGDDPTLLRWLVANGVGIVHLHGLGNACREGLAALEGASLPYLVTLHDLMFINPTAFDAPGMPAPDAAWIAGLAGTLERAAAVIAPSAFIRDVARAGFPQLDVAVIPLGVRTQATPDAARIAIDAAVRAQRFVVAVVGAIGPHKGSGILDALAAALADSDVELIVIGYTDTQLNRGWQVPGRYYVHGPYEDHELPDLLAAYGVDIVLFPNRLPESFSYTLSEVWLAGVPVVVPDEGALGERVAAHGGGWRLRAGYGADAAARLLLRLFSEDGAAERARVKSQILPNDSKRVPPLEAMSREVDALYARFALPPPASDTSAEPDALSSLLAANLDGFVFRKELLNLAAEMARFEGEATGLKTWNTKLEHDVAVLSEQLAQLVDANRRLKIDKDAFDLLPEFARNYLLKRSLRDRG